MPSNFANSWQKHTPGSLNKTHAHTPAHLVLAYILVVSTAVHATVGCLVHGMLLQTRPRGNQAPLQISNVEYGRLMGDTLIILTGFSRIAVDIT